MVSRISIILTFTLLAAAGCASSEKQGGNNTADSASLDSAAESTAAEPISDSISAGITADTTAVDSTNSGEIVLQPPPPAPAPATVELKGRIIQLPARDGNSMQLKVTAVKNYGSSLPAVAIGDTLTVGYPDTAFIKIKNHIGKIVSAVLSYHKSPDTPDPASPWHLVSLDNNP